MIKRCVALLAALLWLASGAAAQALSPSDVRTWDEAEQFTGGVWPLGRQSYAQENGFSPVHLTPKEACAALNRAYEREQEAGYAAVLRGWGFDQADEAGFWTPYGWPERRTLGESVRLGEFYADLEVIRFTGGFADASDNSLIFMKKEYGDWQLIDLVMGDARELRVAGDEGDTASAFIELLTVGHGTGFYAEQIDVYNPVTRRCEAAYTREGFDCPLEDRNMYLSAWADYDYDGLKVVATAVFGGYEGQGDARVFTQRAQVSDVYVYAYDAADRGLHLRVHERHEGLNPAVLRAQSVGDYLSGGVLFVY